MRGLKRRPPADPTERTALRSRKRFTRRQWRRRWLAWRYVVAALLVVALVAGGTWLVYFSDVLTVKRVDVEGNNLLTRNQVLKTARVPSGEQLARVDIGAISARVSALAAVRSVDVSRKWPDGVQIVIDERVAVAVIEIGGRLRGLDSEGVVFNEYAKAPPGLPRISSTSSTTPDALKEAATVVAALPKELSAMVDHVEVLLQLLRQPAKVYDVSVPGQPTTCPEASAEACLRQP